MFHKKGNSLESNKELGSNYEGNILDMMRNSYLSR
jgi:hypothetical protein